MVPATVTPRGSDALVEFIQPQRAITPGQAAVIYFEEEVLGGGFINTIDINSSRNKSSLINSIG